MAGSLSCFPFQLCGGRIRIPAGWYPCLGRPSRKHAG